MVSLPTNAPQLTKQKWQEAPPTTCCAPISALFDACSKNRLRYLCLFLQREQSYKASILPLPHHLSSRRSINLPSFCSLSLSLSFPSPLVRLLCSLSFSRKRRWSPARVPAIAATELALIHIPSCLLPRRPRATPNPSPRWPHPRMRLQQQQQQQQKQRRLPPRCIVVRGQVRFLRVGCNESSRARSTTDVCVWCCQVASHVDYEERSARKVSLHARLARTWDFDVITSDPCGGATRSSASNKKSTSRTLSSERR